MMYPAIDDPEGCEIPYIIRFPHVENMSAAEIHRELCETVYDQTVLSEGTVRQWCRMLIVKRANKCSR
jgi:hypothetical protein